MVKILESLLNQKVKWSSQQEIQDHIQVRFQFQGRDNLPEGPGDFHNLEFGQVQMCSEIESGFPKRHDSWIQSVELGI